mmetsp:Transcript_11391/g.30174  ORF Transcript_11391/g.30174 Transcript_11391/m.30174 type:complete len:662 (+) Transcript_11391:90-2075(+)
MLLLPILRQYLFPTEEEGKYWAESDAKEVREFALGSLKSAASSNLHTKFELASLLAVSSVDAEHDPLSWPFLKGAEGGKLTGVDARTLVEVADALQIRDAVTAIAHFIRDNDVKARLLALFQPSPGQWLYPTAPRPSSSSLLIVSEELVEREVEPSVVMARARAIAPTLHISTPEWRRATDTVKHCGMHFALAEAAKALTESGLSGKGRGAIPFPALLQSFNTVSFDASAEGKSTFTANLLTAFAIAPVPFIYEFLRRSLTQDDFLPSLSSLPSLLARPAFAQPMTIALIAIVDELVQSGGDNFERVIVNLERLLSHFDGDDPLPFTSSDLLAQCVLKYCTPNTNRLRVALVLLEALLIHDDHLSIAADELVNACACLVEVVPTLQQSGEVGQLGSSCCGLARRCVELLAGYSQIDKRIAEQVKRLRESTEWRMRLLMANIHVPASRPPSPLQLANSIPSSSLIEGALLARRFAVSTPVAKLCRDRVVKGIYGRKDGLARLVSNFAATLPSLSPTDIAQLRYWWSEDERVAAIVSLNDLLSLAVLEVSDSTNFRLLAHALTTFVSFIIDYDPRDKSVDQAVSVLIKCALMQERRGFHVGGGIFPLLSTLMSRLLGKAEQSCFARVVPRFTLDAHMERWMSECAASSTGGEEKVPQGRSGFL